MSGFQKELFVSAVVCLQDFARLLFNFLRVSPTYSLVAQQAGTTGGRRPAVSALARPAR